jgi:hypothetical protein
MTENRDYLYNLLPAIYHQRDLERGEPLRGLMAVMEEVMRSLESDIDDLYENWFIETCEDWIVSYIGDLMGVTVLQPITPDSFNQRAFVANTMAYRRRKGTLFVVEQLAKDATGWPARAVEFFQRLITTQNLNHLRLSSPLTPDLRDPRGLELLDGPFDTAPHIVSLGGGSDGDYNIKNVGLFFWVCRSYSVVRATARHHKNGLFWFSPLGIDMPLFNRPRPEREITHLAEEVNVPGRLRKWALYWDLENYRRSIDCDEPSSLYFSEEGSVFEIILDGESDPIPPENILICDLDGNEDADWALPTSNEGEYRAAVDPERGRLAILDESVQGQKETAPKVQVSYCYGFSADIGGGPYDRRDSIRRWLNSPEWSGNLDRLKILVVSQDKTSLEEAIESWNSYAAENRRAAGLIIISDSGSYDAPSINIPAGCKLAIVGSDLVKSDGGAFSADLLDTGSYRPHIRGRISVNREEGEEDSTRSNELVLDGLLIEGNVQVGDLESLRLSHSTIVPERGGLFIQGEKNIMSADIFRTICGTISSKNKFLNLEICDSIIDGLGGTGISADDANIRIETSTVLGTTRVLSLEAENTIFIGNVTAKRGQTGCVRFSYLPLGSQTPRRYRCQPEMALKEADDPCVERAVLKKVMPIFTSKRYGHPGYGRLSTATPEEIRSGAEEGLEMGVFNILKQSHRDGNLQSCMDEYLPLGLELKIRRID